MGTSKDTEPPAGRKINRVRFCFSFEKNMVLKHDFLRGFKTIVFYRVFEEAFKGIIKPLRAL